MDIFILQNRSLHEQETHLIFELAGAWIPSWQSWQFKAAAGGLVRSESQRIKQLLRTATLWELGNVAGPPFPSPSSSVQAGFRGISKLGSGRCTSLEAKHKP